MVVCHRAALPTTTWCGPTNTSPRAATRRVLPRCFQRLKRRLQDARRYLRSTEIWRRQISPSSTPARDPTSLWNGVELLGGWSQRLGIPHAVFHALSRGVALLELCHRITKSNRFRRDACPLCQAWYSTLSPGSWYQRSYSGPCTKQHIVVVFLQDQDSLSGCELHQILESAANKVRSRGEDNSSPFHLEQMLRYLYPSGGCDLEKVRDMATLGESQYRASGECPDNGPIR